MNVLSLQTMRPRTASVKGLHPISVTSSMYNCCHN